MTTSSGLKISTLSYVILYVKDTNKAVAFYRDKLGLKLKMNEQGWAEFDTGATTLALHGSDKAIAAPSETAPIVVFGVDNIQESFKELQDLGIQFESEPHQVCEDDDNKAGFSADFCDPDGNKLSIFGKVSKKD